MNFVFSIFISQVFIWNAGFGTTENPEAEPLIRKAPKMDVMLNGETEWYLVENSNFKVNAELKLSIKKSSISGELNCAFNSPDGLQFILATQDNIGFKVADYSNSTLVFKEHATQLEILEFFADSIGKFDRKRGILKFEKSSRRSVEFVASSTFLFGIRSFRKDITEVSAKVYCYVIQGRRLGASLEVDGMLIDIRFGPSYDLESEALNSSLTPEMLELLNAISDIKFLWVLGRDTEMEGLALLSDLSRIYLVSKVPRRFSINWQGGKRTYFSEKKEVSFEAQYFPYNVKVFSKDAELETKPHERFVCISPATQDSSLVEQLSSLMSRHTWSPINQWSSSVSESLIEPPGNSDSSQSPNLDESKPSSVRDLTGSWQFFTGGSEVELMVDDNERIWLNFRNESFAIIKLSSFVSIDSFSSGAVKSVYVSSSVKNSLFDDVSRMVHLYYSANQSKRQLTIITKDIIGASFISVTRVDSGWMRKVIEPAPSAKWHITAYKNNRGGSFLNFGSEAFVFGLPDAEPYSYKTIGVVQRKSDFANLSELSYAALHAKSFSIRATELDITVKYHVHVSGILN